MVRAIDFLGRLTRAHALLLTCTCALLLLFNYSPSGALLPSFTWPGTSNINEEQVDAALQSAAENALANRQGSIIVMDAQTGRVRAAVNPEGAYEQAMMPGSSIKPFTTLAALRAGLIQEESRTVCPGRFTGLSFSLPCVHANHLPPFNPSQAIAHSCNYYFATLGQRLGPDKLTVTLRQFGFGQPSGLDSSEAGGVVRPCDGGDVARMRPVESHHASQRADCAAREALGESEYIQVTPIQLLTAYAALLNDGRLLQPQTGPAESVHPVERNRINISAAERQVIVEGMAGAIRYGTARSARLDTVALTIVGKTGTAVPPKGFRLNGWFVGLAGSMNAARDLAPSEVQLAVIVFLPRAHGSEAARVSRPIFEAYANEISHRGTEKADAETRRRGDAEKGSENNLNKSSSSVLSASPRPRVAASSSSVRVHSVSENVTRELLLEDYVLGVVRAEGSMETEPEALKALAIAVRTFARKNIGRHEKDGYDFCSTTHCQRFRYRDPTVREGASLVEAVRATEGQVLHDDRAQLVESYFGASCGGETANIATLWGTTPASHLRGVNDEFCESGPHARWTDTVTRNDLLRALQSDSRTDVGGRLDRVIINKRDDTSRAEFVTLEGEQRKVVRGWDFKIIVGRALGWQVLKSSRFEVSRAGSNFIFRGRGFGHGLGLCQEGAHVMAARGVNYQRILEKYFPGTRVAPRSGDMSLARPFKAGTRQVTEYSAASAASDFFVFQSSLTRRASWKADAFPALKGRAKLTRRFAALLPLARFVTISSENFSITYPADNDRRDVNQILSVLQNARADYLRRATAASIPISSLPFLEIRFNDSTGNFVGRTGQPWWAAAATKGNRIETQPLPLLKRRGVLHSTLKHELAHVIINIIGRDRAPRWLEEGFAIYLAGEGQMFSRYQRRTKLTSDELEQRMQRPTSQKDMRASYAEAYLKVSGMINSEGESSVWKKIAAS